MAVLYIIDSFGIQPPIELVEYWNRSVNHIDEVIYNSEQHQEPDDTICGYLCLKFLSQWKNNNHYHQ